MPERINKKRSRSEWEQLMAGYEAGNLAQRAFCARHSVAYSSFCYWRKRLRSPATVESQAPLMMQLIDTFIEAERLKLKMNA